MAHYSVDRADRSSEQYLRTPEDRVSEDERKDKRREGEKGGHLSSLQCCIKRRRVSFIIITACLHFLPLFLSFPNRKVQQSQVYCVVGPYFMSILVLQSSLMGKRELVALLSLSSWCLVIDVWLFLPVPWVCLQFVIVVFPDHTHYFR